MTAPSTHVTAPSAHTCVPEFHRVTDLSSVPAVPGIYAWYVVPGAGPADWRRDLDPSTGKDRGSDRLARIYGAHGRRLRHPLLAFTLRMPLWAKWQGTAEESGHQQFAQLVNDLAITTDSAGAKLRETLRLERTRSVLADLLESAAPRLTAPVYVGVAKDLQDRLSTHVKGLAECLDAQKAHAPFPRRFSGTFSSRATEAGIRQDDLRFAFMPADPVGTLSGAEQRDLVEAAEFLINRWHRPIFGVK